MVIQTEEGAFNRAKKRPILKKRWWIIHRTLMTNMALNTNNTNSILQFSNSTENWRHDDAQMTSTDAQKCPQYAKQASCWFDSPLQQPLGHQRCWYFLVLLVLYRYQQSALELLAKIHGRNAGDLIEDDIDTDVLVATWLFSCPLSMGKFVEWKCFIIVNGSFYVVISVALLKTRRVNRHFGASFCQLIANFKCRGG